MPYLLASALSMTLFFGVYWLCLRRLAFPSANRLYLLAALGASLLIPLVEVPDWFSAWTTVPEVVTPVVSLDPQPASDWREASVPAAGPEPTSQPVFNWFQVLGAVLLLGAVAAAGRLSLSLWRLGRLLRQPAEHRDGLTVVPTSGGNASFFHYILLNAQALTPAEREQVLAHEAEHARRYHSIDRLFVELLLIPFWWNPFLYAYRAALIEVHEWEVDSALTRYLDRRTYASLLLKLHTAPLPLANLLGRPLRARIERILQPQTPTAVKKTAYLIALPVLLASVLVFGQAPVSPRPPAPPAPEALAPEPPEPAEEGEMVEPAEPPVPPAPEVPELAEPAAPPAPPAPPVPPARKSGKKLKPGVKKVAVLVPAPVPAPTPQVDARPGVLERVGRSGTIARMNLNLKNYSPAFLERAKQFFKEEGAEMTITNERLDMEGKLLSVEIRLRRAGTGQAAFIDVKEKEVKEGWLYLDLERDAGYMGFGPLPSPPAASKPVYSMVRPVSVAPIWALLQPKPGC